MCIFNQAARDGDQNAIINIIKGLQERYRENEATVRYKLNKKDRSDYTALHYAVRYGHENVTQLLVKNGAGMSSSARVMNYCWKCWGLLSAILFNNFLFKIFHIEKIPCREFLSLF